MLTCRNIDINSSLVWDELIKESSTATFFQTKDWLEIWKKHFVGQDITTKDLQQNIQSPKYLNDIYHHSVVGIGVWDKDELIGIAPFEIRESVINFLGVNPVVDNQLVSDFGDIIAVSGKEREVWGRVLTWYRVKGEGERGKGLELNFIREDSVSFEILQELGGSVEEVATAPFIDLPKTWEEYLASLGRHERHELRRKIRRLEEERAFKVCTEGEPTDIEEFFRLMVLSNEQKRNFLSNKMREFFQDIFHTFWPKKMLRLCFLKLKGENIAAVLLFEYKNELLLYNSGFDPKYAKLSPGLLLKAYMIKQAIEEGKGRFDFLRGGERYKYDLGGRERRLYKITLSACVTRSYN